MGCFMDISFLTVTELAGDEISQEQLERMQHRYCWAAQYCSGKNVLEVACGTGPGLGILNTASAHFEAGDYDKDILAIARSHYGNRVNLKQFDATAMPYPDKSKDVIILFEALYYIENAQQFINECMRILRPNGIILISTANKDLSDFNPSPHSYKYYGVKEMNEIFSVNGFLCEFFGYINIDHISSKQRLLRPIKRAAVSLGLMPKTMASKRLLKRLVFGRLLQMPFELDLKNYVFNVPLGLNKNASDERHKVLYCLAQKAASI